MEPLEFEIAKTQVRDLFETGIQMLNYSRAFRMLARLRSGLCVMI